MLREIFSNSNWYLATTVIGVLYAFYLMSLSNNKLIKGTDNNVIPWVIAAFVTLYLGTRPTWAYGDTRLYTEMYDLLQKGIWTEVKGSESEPFWAMVQYASIPFLSASGWLTVISIFYVGGMSISARRWLPHHFLMALIFLFTSFSFFSYGNNGIRNGMATSIAMVGLSLFNKSRKELAIGYVFLIMACLTHKSCLIIFAAATAARFFKNININVGIWFGCILLSLLFAEPLKNLMSGLIDDGRASYYINQQVSTQGTIAFSRTGFRWDFLLYSALPIALGWYAITKQKIKDETYIFLLTTYIFANSVWCLINSVAYSNRFAYLSWFLYPIIIVYPLAKLKVTSSQGVIAGGLLIFFIIFNWIFF